MITPNIAPRKIMGSAAAGLFSAAKSSVRRMEKTTEAISKSPDITKEQKLGINYVQFFGSKKNAKILKKSLKSIRDSLVATFAIAKMLRSEVSKNVKLIGEKTKGKKGLFGLGFGGILSLISLLTNPLILGAIGIGAGVAGIGFLGKFLIDNRDKIINFIMDKANGLYDFLQSFVSNVVRDFLSDRTKSPELRNLEFESDEKINKRQKELEQGDEEKNIEPLLPNDARLQAVKEEIQRLSSERDALDNLPRGEKTEDTRNRVKALTARIDELKTGEVTTDRLGGLEEFLFGEKIRDAIGREGPFLKEGTDYLGMTEDQKLENLDKLFRKFVQMGNDPSRIKEIYQQELLDPNLSADRIAQARDMISLATIRDTNKSKGKSEDFQLKEQFTPSVKDTKISNLNNNASSSSEDTGGGLSDGTPTAFRPNTNGGSDLAQVPVGAEGASSFIDHINFDPENDYVDYNASMFNIVNV